MFLQSDEKRQGKRKAAAMMLKYFSSKKTPLLKCEKLVHSTIFSGLHFPVKRAGEFGQHERSCMFFKYQKLMRMRKDTNETFIEL